MFGIFLILESSSFVFIYFNNKQIQDTKLSDCGTMDFKNYFYCLNIYRKWNDAILNSKKI